MCFNVKIFVKMLKILALTANLSHIPRVQKLGLRPTALAFLYPRLGQKPAQAKSQARLFLAWLGPASGFRPELAHHYWHLLRGQESHHGSFPAMKYFYTWLFDLHNCTSSQAIKGAHLEIIQPRWHSEHILHVNLHQVYSGSVTKYFKNCILLSRAPNKAISC